MSEEEAIDWQHFQARLEDLTRIAEELRFVREEDQEAWNTLKERLDRIEKQVIRSGKEQFRANALTEATQAQLGTVLETLKALDEERGQELERARAALQGARTEGRVAFFTRFLPAMDSLEEALAAGHRQLAGWIQDPAGAEPPASLPLRVRLYHAWRLATGAWLPWELTAEPREQLRPEALAAWLKGLDLLRERLLEHFAQEGILPMETLGRAFDPHLHLAFETVQPDPHHPAGTIVREARPGYLLGDTVLRYAEVVVAK